MNFKSSASARMLKAVSCFLSCCVVTYTSNHRLRTSFMKCKQNEFLMEIVALNRMWHLRKHGLTGDLYRKLCMHFMNEVVDALVIVLLTTCKHTSWSCSCFKRANFETLQMIYHVDKFSPASPFLSFSHTSSCRLTVCNFAQTLDFWKKLIWNYINRCNIYMNLWHSVLC